MAKLSAGKLDLNKLAKTIIVFTDAKTKLCDNASKLDKQHKQLISNAIKVSRYQGGKGETLTIATPQLSPLENIVIVGLGELKSLTENTWRDVGIEIGHAVDKIGTDKLSIVMETGNIKEDKTDTTDISKALAEGMEMSLYRFDKFRTKQKAHQASKIKELTLLFSNSKDEANFKKITKATEYQVSGTNLARDLVNLPPNYANPDYMAKEAKRIGKLAGVKTTILGEKEMKKLGMGLLLAVGRGSPQESRLIIMKYTGNPKSKSYKALVGKGVMFDTGGYNLKPGAGMVEMKSDMGGSAAVMGTMQALAERRSKVNVIGVCGCVVNMVDGEAFLPSDILTAYNGMTVEIGNTDAEGRLVLADALAYINKKEKPTEIIDLATLTGAVMGALGGFYAGIFTKNDKMAEALMSSGTAVGEALWRLPMNSGYKSKPRLADLNNNGTPYGGASCAAVFLQNFVGKTPWTHLDIAGMAMSNKIPGGPNISEASGFGVRLLVKYLEKG